MENIINNNFIVEDVTDAEVELPDQYDPATWPKSLPTPKALAHNAQSQLKLQLTFETISTRSDGYFGCKLVVSWLNNHFRSEFQTPPTHNTIKIAQHTVALQFLKNPPEWLTKCVNDEDYRLKVAEEVKTRAEKGDPQIWTVEKEKAGNVELNSPPKDEYTFANLTKDLEDKEAFIDIFGDDRLKVKVLKKGSGWVETGSKVSIHYICRRNSDGAVFEDSFKEGGPIAIQTYRQDGHILCLDFVCSMLKVGGEAIVSTDALYAYGEEGLPGKVKPNESVLIFVRLISVSKGNSMTADDIKALEAMAPQERLTCGNEFKAHGNRFYYVRHYKLALDQYILGLRVLPPKKKSDQVGEKAEKNTMKDLLLLLRASLLGNIAACWMKLEEWDLVIETTTESLDINEDLKVRMRLCCALIATMRLDEAKKELDLIRKIEQEDFKANEVEQNSQWKKSFDLMKLERQLAEATKTYEAKARVMEKKMAAGLLAKKK